MTTLCDTKRIENNAEINRMTFIVIIYLFIMYKLQWWDDE